MVDWNDAQTRILINERRDRNEEYHNLGRNKDVFWRSIATRINEELGSNFLGHHCKEKFRNLVRDYNVSVSVNSPLKRRRFLNLTLPPMTRQCVNI